MSFILSKLFWSFLAPANLFALLLLGLAFLVGSRKEKRRKIGAYGLSALAALVFFVAMFPVGAWFLAPIENRFPLQMPAHVDGIVMLAGAEDPVVSETRAPPALGDTSQRFITFVTLARRYPDARLAYVGGSPTLWSDKRYSNAALAKETLAGLGVDVNRVVFEDLSRNTFENASFGYRDVKPGADEKWLLVTSAFHMPRAMGCFRKAGWHVYAAPTDFRTPQNPSMTAYFNLFRHVSDLQLAIHEYVGLLAYRLMGRTDSLWPQPTP